MLDLSKHQLNSKSEIIELESRYGSKFQDLKEAIHKYLANLPCDVWIDFTIKTTEKNLPVFIKIICDYINTHRNISDYIEFNQTFTRIRRKVCTYTLTPNTLSDEVKS